jgi:hypothetical protein
MIKEIGNRKNVHLLISILIVIPVALVYGFQPQLLFDVTINSIDEANIFKAIMGFYLAFSSLWILGIFKQKYWYVATTSNMFFLLGLALGRIISLLIDGIPSLLFVMGTVGEVVLGFYAFYQLKNQKNLD